MLVKKVFLVERRGENGHLLIPVSALSQYTWHLLQCKHDGNHPQYFHSEHCLYLSFYSEGH